MGSPTALKALVEVGVNPEGIVDFAELFFVDDGQWIELPFDKFMEMVLDMREANTATFKDVLNVWKQVKATTNKAIDEMHQKVDALTKKYDEKSDSIDSQVNTILT